MSLYLLYRLREFANVGFSGFEGRHYSLFENLEYDMAHATNLQTLVTALAFKLVFQGKVTHSHIPDDPFIESERRQIVFGSAIGLPTFFILNKTGNLFMKRIMEHTKAVRYSRRYPGFLRVYNRQYRLALVDFILKEGADLIEMLDLRETMVDLRRRLETPECSATGKLTSGILQNGGIRSPMRANADEFNLEAERYYRTTLKKLHLLEGLKFLNEDFRSLDSEIAAPGRDCREAISYSINNRAACEFLEAISGDLLNENVPLEILVKLINLTLTTIHCDSVESSRNIGSRNTYGNDAAPICREGNW